MFGFAGREGGWAGLGWVFLLGWAGLGWAVGLAGGWGGRGLDSLGLGLGLEVLGPDWGSGAGAGLEGAGYLDVAAGLGSAGLWAGGPGWGLGGRGLDLLGLGLGLEVLGPDWGAGAGAGLEGAGYPDVVGLCSTRNPMGLKHLLGGFGELSREGVRFGGSQRCLICLVLGLVVSEIDGLGGSTMAMTSNFYLFLS